mmetsp:Transcript_102413/g.298637  ORF Transcript_102413/g.298637 Transcript_102413/m.298637 type:complete len:305 (-) Transcript_102413:123-1037(-)
MQRCSLPRALLRGFSAPGWQPSSASRTGPVTGSARGATAVLREPPRRRSGARLAAAWLWGAHGLRGGCGGAAARRLHCCAILLREWRPGGAGRRPELVGGLAGATRAGMLEVLIKDDVVVVLRPEPGEAEVFRKEGLQLGRGPVVRELCCMQPLAAQHGVKELSAVATALATLMDVKIQGANGIDLAQVVADRGCSPPTSFCWRRGHVETLSANLQEAQCCAPRGEHVDVLARQVRHPRGHWLSQSLGCAGGLPHDFKHLAEGWSSLSSELCLINGSNVRPGAVRRRAQEGGQLEGELHEAAGR